MSANLPQVPISIADCFADFVGRYSNPEIVYRSHQKHLKFLTEFGGFKTPAVQSWVQGSHSPKGDEYLRLMYFLELIGYEVEEIQALKPEVRQFTRLIVFGVITFEEAQELLRFPHRQNLYNPLRSNKGMMTWRWRSLIHRAITESPKLPEVQDSWAKRLKEELGINARVVNEAGELKLPESRASVHKARSKRGATRPKQPAKASVGGESRQAKFAVEGSALVDSAVAAILSADAFVKLLPEELAGEVLRRVGDQTSNLTTLLNRADNQ